MMNFHKAISKLISLTKMKFMEEIRIRLLMGIL